MFIFKKPAKYSASKSFHCSLSNKVRLSDVWGVRWRRRSSLLWGACVPRGTVTVIVSRQKHFSECSRGLCDLLFPGTASGFCFGQKLFVLPHMYAQGWAQARGGWRIPCVGFDTVTVASQRLNHLVVFSSAVNSHLRWFFPLRRGGRRGGVAA